MKTADAWCDEVFGEPWQKSDTVTLTAGEANQLFRRIQADALRHAAVITKGALQSEIYAEAAKLEQV
jgi:hypothetical protein